VSRPDLISYFLMNRGLRQEFGLLALAGRTVRGESHRELIEDQLQLCLSLLQHVNHEQDTWVFPTVRDRQPDALPGIETLQQDHGALAHLASDARHREQPIEERSAVLHELHESLNEHIDREERDLTPLITSSLTADEWEHSGRRILNGIPQEQMPVMYGWLLSATPEEEQAAAMKALPRSARLLFKHRWCPAYLKRVQDLYR
jgi:iron-sulfur cluster repair protein YtfE (RIC family)